MKKYYFALFFAASMMTACSGKGGNPNEPNDSHLQPFEVEFNFGTVKDGWRRITRFLLSRHRRILQRQRKPRPPDRQRQKRRNARIASAPHRDAKSAQAVRC